MPLAPAGSILLCPTGVILLVGERNRESAYGASIQTGFVYGLRRHSDIILDVRTIAWRALYVITKLFLLMLAKVFFRLEAYGTENIPKDGGIIIASNHLSHLDPPVLGVCVPRHIFHVAKQELAQVKPLALVFRIFGTILIDRSRGKKALQIAEEYVSKGLAVIIFPEGTRSVTGRLQRGRTGVAVVAMRCGAPIVPAVVIGTDKAMRKHSKFIRPAKVIVKFGKPIHVEKVESAVIPRDRLLATTKKVMDAIEELLPEGMRPLPDEKQSYYPLKI